MRAFAHPSTVDVSKAAWAKTRAGYLYFPSTENASSTLPGSVP